MNKLLTEHEVEYLLHKKAKNPSGTTYGIRYSYQCVFEGLVIETFRESTEDFLCPPQCALGKSHRFWKFGPEPYEGIFAAAYNLIDVHEKPLNVEQRKTVEIW